MASKSRTFCRLVVRVLAAYALGPRRLPPLMRQALQAILAA